MIVRRFTRWLLSRPEIARRIRTRLERMTARKHPNYCIGDTTDGVPVFWHYRLFRLWGWEASIHQILRGDPPLHFHSHPSYNWRFILAGGYVEEELKLLPDGQLPAITHFLPWHPGDFGCIDPLMTHRFDSVKRGTFTLWISGPKVADIEIYDLSADKRSYDQETV